MVHHRNRIPDVGEFISHKDNCNVVTGWMPVDKLEDVIIYPEFLNFLTEFGYDVNYFSNGDYDKETFRLNGFPFVFHTVGAARKLLADGGIY